MFQVPELLTVLVNLLATGSSLLLLRRGPSRRLRLLILAVGIMSMAQLSGLVYASFHTATWFAQFQHVMVGIMALFALHLLYKETGDRNITDLRLRLAEHERTANPAQLHPDETLTAGNSTVQESKVKLAHIREWVNQEEGCTADLLALSFAIGKSVRPAAGEVDEPHTRSQGTDRN